MTSDLLLLPPLAGIDDLSVLIPLPVQSLATAVTKALILPFHGNPTLGAHRVCAIYLEQPNLSYRHRLPKGPGWTLLTHVRFCSHNCTSSRNNSAKRSRLGWGRTDTA